MYTIEDNRLLFSFNRYMACVEAWGENALRIRISRNGKIAENAIGALGEHKLCQADIQIISENKAAIRNGKIKAVFDNCALTFYNNNGDELTGECWAGSQGNYPKPFHDPLRFAAHSWRPEGDGNYQVEYRMKAYDDEKIFGMGQYQDGIFNLKGTTLDMRPRNKQASIPFMLSSRGYGLLWNNTAVGRVTFASNYTQWEAFETEGIDYWITAGDTPVQIERQYQQVTGCAPMMPEYAMGFWQCKLRYKTQDELMSVAREYYRRGIPLKVIVIDFFHWNEFGNWYLDPKYWPDPEGMCRELEEMGIKLAVSVWPTIGYGSENWNEMYSRGMLIEQKGALPFCVDFAGISTVIDVTNPETREYVWNICKRNYADKGVTLYWLDCAEPEYNYPDEMYMYSYRAGSAEKVGNAYPRDYARLFYDGQRADGVEAPLSLIRCAWAGSQKYGALLWSGDIDTNWETMRRQVIIGQQVGIAGLPWWTTDIGGFIGGDRANPAFTELLLRWFEWMTFCPVLRMHGDRSGEHEEELTPPNEIWSYGEKAYEIMKAHIEKREALRPYIRSVMLSAHEDGDPAIRPLFYEFPEDKTCWETPYEHMFGPDLLIAPVLQPGVTELSVYLPAGCDWVDERNANVYKGGRAYMMPAPIESIPVLKRVKA